MRVQLEKAPEEILRRAVYGMLPKNNLRKVLSYKRCLFCCKVRRLHSCACCAVHANETHSAVFLTSQRYHTRRSTMSCEYTLLQMCAF